MLQALHIFKKDVRHLRYEILMVEALIAGFAYFAARSQPAVTAYSSDLDRVTSVYELVLPLAFWYLIAAVMHEEPIPGHQQFWLTRPYSWKSLLGAKALFILAWVNLPILVTDCVIVKAQGFQVLSYVPSLLCRQLLFTAVWLLPLAALAAITKNLRQFLLGLLIVPLTLFISMFFPNAMIFLWYWGGVEWIPNSIFIGVLALAAIAVLLCQYSKRQSTFARILAVFGFALALALPLLLPPSVFYILQFGLSRLTTNEPSVHIALDPTRNHPSDSYTDDWAGTAEVDLPLQVTGAPEGQDLIADYLTVTIERSDGKTWQDAGRARFYQSRDGLWMKIHVGLQVFGKLKKEPVTLHTTAYLTLLGNRRSTQIEAQKSTAVPGFGLCSFLVSSQQTWTLICRAPFRRSPLFWGSGDTGDETLVGGSYSPYPAESGISPLVANYQSSGSSSGWPLKATKITTEAPLRHFKHDFEMDGVRLDEHAIESRQTH
jgi:hypothetical protein